MKKTAQSEFADMNSCLHTNGVGRPTAALVSGQHEPTTGSRSPSHDSPNGTTVRKRNGVATSERLQVYLEDFRVSFEPELESYLSEKLVSLGKIDQAAELITKVIRDFTMGGGKRLRAALVTLGYHAIHEELTSRILRPAISVEMLQSYFLIHDDVIDQSDLRRYRPTVHRVFEDKYQDIISELRNFDHRHFSYSMALLAGDLCCALAYEALLRSDFSSDLILSATQRMHKMMEATAIGEVLDVLRALERNVSEETVLNGHLLKTAKYTFEWPLHLGMILGGATAECLGHMSSYAIPLGIAFQLQDDITGILGLEEECGKSVISDLEEGKQTLLTVFVHDRGSPAQRQRLDSLLGKKGITVGELDEVRQIVHESGALAYSKERAHGMVSEGKHALKRMSLSRDVHDTLSDLADYVVSHNV